MKKFDVSFLDGANILITGGTGSFGQHLVQFLLKHGNPKRLIIFSRDELKQYEMQQRFAELDKNKCLRFFLGDVRDSERLRMAFREVDYVVHAAALKQVVAAEYNPFEFIKTNVIGAENVVQAALSNKVKGVVALSTDKAANPINLYGTSKLASDKIFIAANHLSGSIGTKFAVVRYGNVVGSRGSVVPLFKRLIDEGIKELPITDKRMTRFWITLTQGVEFVLSSMQIMHGGELFVPKIPSMKMTDLARVMAPNLDLKIIGIRPGEKIHEVMVTEEDSRHTIELKDRYVILPTYRLWGKENDELYKYDSYVGQVDDGFYYASNTNDNWLSEDDLKTMIADSNAA